MDLLVRETGQSERRPGGEDGGRVVSGARAEGGAALLGGKGANLAALTGAGLPVPAWLCLTSRLCADVLAGARGDIAKIAAGIAWEDRAAVRAASDAIGDRVRAAGLASADRDALHALAGELFADDARLAVRSSAIGEDSDRDSFAGQMDSYLHVPRARLVERVLDCLASAFSERALLYRHLRGHDPVAVEAAVLVQAMVESRVSGVLFTANPTTGDTDEAVVAAGLGLGEGIVGGLVESDTFFAALATGEVRDRAIEEKRSRVVRDPTGAGTRVEEIEPDARPALTDGEVARLVALGRDVAELRGGPQDLEWTIDGDGRIHLLQTRPITTLGRSRESVFDNSNIVESYPGLSLPLTFSVAREGYEIIFRATARRLGVPGEVLRSRRAVFANLIGLLDGRIYYNIGNWYQMYAMVPGVERLLPAWEKALGLEKRHTRPTTPPAATVAERRSQLGIARRVLAEFRALDEEVEAYVRRLAAVQADFRRRDLSAMDAPELYELWEEVAELREPYSISVVNDFFTQQLYDLLGKLVERFELGDPISLRNELLCGEKGMESVEPVRSLLALTDRVRRDPRLRELLSGDRSDAEVWRQIVSDPAHAEFLAAASVHFERYGDRTLHELKLETPPLDETPEFLVAMLRNYLRGGQDIDAMERRERAIRDGAEEKIERRLRGHPVRRAIFSRVLRDARRTIRHRENLRLARTRGNGMFKRIFRALARRFAGCGLLEREEDVFYLTHEEIAGTIRGHAATRDLRALVDLRKRDYARFALTRPDPRVVARGIVYENRFERAQTSGPAATDGALRGIGCSPGRVAAPAKVILDPQGDVALSGEILIAPMTDPGWVFLMVAAGGIVSEKGSMLSHTAIIGRELGIPTVVGVKDATLRIRDGQRIEIDGERGLVTLVPPEGA